MFFACEDKNPDYANEVTDVYKIRGSNFPGVLVERTGTNEIRISDSTFSVFQGYLNVQITSETVTEIDKMNRAYYTTSDSNINFLVGEVIFMNDTSNAVLEMKEFSFSGLRK
ncbi:MAG: hypothetical protein ACJAWV_002950 [Flammeovirgaceae bacterium]|jgi:hypothetical protein